MAADSREAGFQEVDSADLAEEARAAAARAEVGNVEER